MPTSFTEIFSWIAARTANEVQWQGYSRRIPASPKYRMVAFPLSFT